MYSIARNQTDLIGNTPLLEIRSLSKLSGSTILAKCEFANPGGSIKDRAALQMVLDAAASGDLLPSMTIVEGTAGNTGIGLAIVSKSLGYKCLIVMPSGQTPEKEKMIALHGASLKLVNPTKFSDSQHFYHVARSIAQEAPDQFWWANQFENTSNFRAHYTQTGPEIFEQCGGHVDYLVSAAGTGGTIGGCSTFLKEQLPHIQVHLVDPEGSGLCSYVRHGSFCASGSSISEGIGIMRLVKNFAQAKVDRSFTIPDSDLVTISRYVRDQDGIVLGTSSALNLAGALYTALGAGKGKQIVTFLCDLGERSFSKLYNETYLMSKGISPHPEPIQNLVNRYRQQEL
jgi:cysteine synthase A